MMSSKESARVSFGPSLEGSTSLARSTINLDQGFLTSGSPNRPPYVTGINRKEMDSPSLLVSDPHLEGMRKGVACLLHPLASAPPASDHHWVLKSSTSWKGTLGVPCA